MRSLVCMLLFICGICVGAAYDFEEDGICYNILSEEDATVEMTYRCHLPNYYHTDDGMRYTNDITLPPKVTYNGKEYKVIAIGKYAVECGRIKNFVMPETLVEIKDSAFIYCKLDQYSFPNSLKKIGKWAFFNSTIYDTKLPDSLEEIGACAFNACTMNDTLNIPKSIKKIGDYAFAYNQMKKVKLPDTLDIIANGMLCGCEWLEEVVMPKNATEIGSEAFMDCGHMSKLELPETIKRIGEYAFSRCGWDLVIPKLPDSLEYIGQGALSAQEFDYLSVPPKLHTIEEGGLCCVRYGFSVDSENKHYKTFDDCLYTINLDTLIYIPYKKGNVNIPEGVRRIGNYALSGIELKDITLPPSIMELGEGAFSYSQLKSIKLPDLIEIIPKDAFLGCHLDNVKFPANLRTIEYRAFFDALGGYNDIVCPKIVLPEKLDTIAWNAFGGCGIDTVVSLNPIPPRVGYNGFERYYATRTLIVPVGSKELYANAQEWKDFDIIKESDFVSVSAVESDNIQIEICDGVIRILGKWDETLVEVYDFSGRLLHSGNSPEIHGLPAGIYILKIGSLAKKIVV